jgi:periplasmic protein TonB
MNIKSFLTKTLVLSLFTGSLAIATVSAAEEAAFDVRPVPVKTPPPQFPSAMQREGVSGVVAVRVVIDETGAVSECSVSKSSHAEFEQPAVSAVKNWKFKPASKGGVAVKASVVIPIKFTHET